MKNYDKNHTSMASSFVSSHLSLMLVETSRKHSWPLLRSPNCTGLYCMLTPCTQNKSFYCDTLGWAVPTDLTSTVNNILEALSSKLPFAIKPVQGRFLAHKPQSMGHGSHQCTNTCFQNIPLQKCGKVCDVIVIIVMAAISRISPRLWRLGFLDVKKSLSSQISWLKDPTSHSSYLRRVLIIF